MATKKSFFEEYGKKLGLSSLKEAEKSNNGKSVQSSSAFSLNEAQQKKRKEKAGVVKSELKKINSDLSLNESRAIIPGNEITRNLTFSDMANLHGIGIYTKKDKKKRDTAKKQIEEYKKTQSYKDYIKEDQKAKITRYLADAEKVAGETVTEADKKNIFRSGYSEFQKSIDLFKDTQLKKEYLDEISKDLKDNNTLKMLYDIAESSDGAYLTLPTYTNLKSEQVQSELGKFGKIVHGTAGSIGGMLPSIATGSVPVVGQVLAPMTTFATVQTKAYNQKLLEGYDPASAFDYSVVNGVLESGLQSAMGGISKATGGKTSPLSNNINKITGKFVNNAGVRKFVASATSEIIEEEIQTILDPINEMVTLGEYETLGEALSSITLDDLTTTALSTLLTVGLTEGTTAFKVSNLQKNIDKINKEYGTDFRINTEGKVTDTNSNELKQSEIDEQITKAKISKIQENQINNIEMRRAQTEFDYQNGNITEQQYFEAIESISNELKAFTEEMNSGKVSPITQIEAEQKVLRDKYYKEQITDEQYEAEMDKLNNRLKEIAGKNTETGNVKNAELYFDNSEQSQNYIKFLEKIAKDKGLTFVFDDSIGENVNGYYSNGVITINPNSNRSGEFIAVHELTHAIGTDQMRKIIDTYRKNNPEFNQAVKSLLENYRASELTEEAMADVAGQLFGNQEFINNLATTNPSLFRRIYQEIKYLYHQLTGYKNQDQFIEDLQYKWEQAYRNNKVKIDGSKNFYIENIASFDENEYNKIKQEMLGKKEFANLATIIESDTTIKPGKNIISNIYNEETKTYKDYEIYYKEKGSFKVVKSKISDGDVDVKYSIEDGSRNEKSRGGQSNDWMGNRMVENSANDSANDRLLNFDKKRADSKGENNRYDRQNSRELNNSSFSNETKYSKNTEDMNDFLNKNIPTKDNQGRELSKEQKEYFKDSKAVDNDGNLVTVYHGSKKAGFTTFATKDNVSFYTDNNNVANTYSGSSEMVDTKKLESISDAKSWLKGINNDLYIENNNIYDYDGNVVLEYQNQNELLKNLKYDIQNEIGNTEAGGIYKGYVNITNPYVIDAQGKNWNDITIDKNDNVEKMYETLSNSEKEYLSDLADKTDNMYDNFNDCLEGFYQRLNANNSKLYDKVTIENSIREKLYKTALYNWNDTYVEDLIGKRYTTNDIVNQILEENKNGENYDGVIFKNIIDEGMFDSGSKDQTVSNVYVTLNPNQFKAYDNTTPTEDADIRYSKNTEGMDNFLKNNLSVSKDGKLQDSNGKEVKLETSSTGTTGTLMAIHNLSSRKLQGILELGGFPVPSIAITKTDNVNSNQFGDITVLFDKKTIDPAIKANEVYDRDVWTPTFPSVEYDIGNDDLRKLAKDNNFYEDSNDSIINNVRQTYLYSENLAHEVNGYGIENVLDRMNKDDKLKYLYLKTKDKNYQPQMKPTKYSYDYSNETLQKYVDFYNSNKFNDMSLKDFYYHYFNYGDMELTEDQTKAVKATIRDFVLPEIKQTAETMWEKGNKSTNKEQFLENYIDRELEKYDESYFKYKEFIKDASRLDEFGETQTIDEGATLKQVDKDTNQKEYEKWVEDTFGKMLRNTKKGIRNDADLFTPSGNRRSFEKLHDDYNLKSIVEYMTKQKTVAGEQGFGAGSGFGTLQAQMAHKFSSIEDIKNYSDKKIVSGAQERELIKPYQDKIYSDMENLVEYYKFKDDRYSNPLDTVGYALNEFAEYKQQNISNLKRKLDEYSFDTNKIPDKLLKKVVDDINSLKNIPTDYFEAKPQRAVGLDEVQAIIIPNDSSIELKQQLQKNGINYYEYDKSIEGDKGRVINQFDDLKFSKNNQNFKEYVEDNFKSTGTTTKFADILKNSKKENVLPEVIKPREVKQTTPKQTTNQLSQSEISELNNLKILDENIGLSSEELERLKYLEGKQKGNVKFPELKQQVEFKDISKEYGKFKRNIGDFNPKLLNKAKETIEGYRNKRTKQQWLDVAENIGSNYKGNAQGLTDYAVQSWFEAQPNMKDNLNRQGQKYVKFSVDEWVNSVYKGAKVGESIPQNTKTENVMQNMIQDVKKSVEPIKKDMKALVDEISDIRQQLGLPDTKKAMNPLEISKLTPESANTTTMLGEAKVSTGEGDSKFTENIIGKTDMLSDEAKIAIATNEDVQYYQKVTNKQSLDKAIDRLNRNGASETLSWFQKDSTKADSTDVAEGWVLLKQYQDAGNYDGMVQVAKKMREIGTKAGQTVQAFNLMERLTPEGMVKYAQSELSEAYDQMVKNKTKEWIDQHRNEFDLTPQEVQFIMDTMQEVQTMPDGYDKRVKLAEIQKVMTDKLPADKNNAIKSWMRISMLFNPKTQVRNVLGNAIIAPVNYLGDVFASKADKMIAKKTGVRTTGTMNTKAILKGFKDGAYQATNDYKKGINTKDMEGNRFEIGEGKAFSEKTLIGRSLNRVDRMLNYIMDAGDRVFSQSSFENSLQNQMILNNTTEITQDMIDIARQESLSRTWNDNNNYTRFVLNVRKGMNALKIGGYGMGDILIPFAKTPANLTKAIVDYSPAGLVKTLVEGKNLKRSLSNGQFTVQQQHQFVQNLGKATAGTMLYVLGYALAKSGVISGESDDDKDTANFLKNTLGVNSYSIKIGDKSFTYDWAQPIASPFSIMANIVNSKNNKEQALLEAVVGNLDTAGSILMEQSFLQSLNDVLTNNDGVVSGLVGELLELPARAIPTFSKQLVDLTDSTQRTSFEYGKPVKSAVNSIKAKIPGLSYTLAPSVDTMGREIQRYGGKNNIFNVFLNPANVSTENISESAGEIYKVYQATGDKTVMPRVAPYYVNKNGEKTLFSSKERAEYQKISGKIIDDAVQKLLSDSKYEDMSDTEKAEIINKLVNYSYNKAQSEVLGTEMSKTYNSISKYVKSGGEPHYYYLHKEEIDYQMKYPDKYNTIKQIASYDDYQKYKKDITNIREKYSKATTEQRKAQVISYVNGLNLTVPQKAMLIKSWYSSFNSYNNQIIEYVDSSDLTRDEKMAVLKDLGFKIKGGRIYW